MKEAENVFDWLQKWYSSHCDGDWEHGSGIKIETLDNPGWYLTVNIEGIECEGAEFNKISVDRSENDWFRCFVKENRFEGPCGPFNLPEVLQIFRVWAEKCKKEKGL